MLIKYFLGLPGNKTQNIINNIIVIRVWIMILEFITFILLMVEL